MMLWFYTVRYKFIIKNSIDWLLSGRR
jgi:hypothetical protein